MPTPAVFGMSLVLGYVAWLLCFRAYIWPWLASMDRVDAQRAIATLNSFRFFGMVAIVPGVVGSKLPADFANFAAYGDLVTGSLAIVALLAVSVRPVFWSLVVIFNLVGIVDITVDYIHAVQVQLPVFAGEFGAAYLIPVIYVPLLMITHVAAFYLLARSRVEASS